MTGVFTPIEGVNFAREIRSIQLNPGGWDQRRFKMESMSENGGKSAWLSGEICSKPGSYFSDSCGHETKKTFATNDIFMRCPVYHQAIRWILFHPAASPQKTLNFNPRSNSFAFLRGRTRENI